MTQAFLHLPLGSVQLVFTYVASQRLIQSVIADYNNTKTAPDIGLHHTFGQVLVTCLPACADQEHGNNLG